MKNIKLDNTNKPQWFCPDIYLTFHPVDPQLSELWVNRDSTGKGARVQLDHGKLWQMASSMELPAEIISLIISAIGEHLLHSNEKLVVTEDDICILRK